MELARIQVNIGILAWVSHGNFLVQALKTHIRERCNLFSTGEGCCDGVLVEAALLGFDVINLMIKTMMVVKLFYFKIK